MEKSKEISDGRQRSINALKKCLKQVENGEITEFTFIGLAHDKKNGENTFSKASYINPYTLIGLATCEIDEAKSRVSDDFAKNNIDDFINSFKE